LAEKQGIKTARRKMLGAEALLGYGVLLRTQLGQSQDKSRVVAAE
jgi:hypothetical protein